MEKRPAPLAEQRVRRGLKPGQLDPETADFAHRMRELAGRRSYLRNFWYAAGARHELLRVGLGRVEATLHVGKSSRYVGSACK